MEMANNGIDVEEQTTLLQLQEIFKGVPNASFFRIVENITFSVHCDEVFPNLFVGDEDSATNFEYLKAIGVTHVVNMADGDVYTGEIFYQDHDIKYLGVDIRDIPTTKIDMHFETVTKFIENGIKGGGKVLVHCLMGYSRSATCAIAYLMMCEGMSAAAACRTIKSKHMCRPNVGFLQQLLDLEIQLKHKSQL